MAEYKLLQSDTPRGLEAMVNAALNEQGMSLHGGPMDLNGRKVQVVVKGMSGDTPGESLEDIIFRLSTAELKASQAALKAGDAKAAAEVATNAMSTLVLGLEMKADLLNGKVPYEQLPEFPVGRKVKVANAAARLKLAAYADLTIAYELDTGDAWGLDSNDDPALAVNWSRLGNAQAIGVQSFNGRTGNIGPQSGDYITAMIPEALGKRYVTEDQIAAWTAKPGPTEIAAAINLALSGGDLPFETKKNAADTFVTKASRGAAGGVAPLGTDGKVPPNNLPVPPVVDLSGLLPTSQKGAASGVAPLDAGKKVPAENLPAFEPQREWVNTSAARKINTWYQNGPYEIQVFAQTNLATDVNFMSIQLRKAATGDTPDFIFYADQHSSTSNKRFSREITIPANCWWRLVVGAGRTIEFVYELKRV